MNKILVMLGLISLFGCGAGTITVPEDPKVVHLKCTEELPGEIFCETDDDVSQFTAITINGYEFLICSDPN